VIYLVIVDPILRDLQADRWTPGRTRTCYHLSARLSSFGDL